MLKDWFYDGKDVISGIVDILLFCLWVALEFTSGADSDGYMFHETIPFWMLIIILIVVPIIIDFIANNFTEKGKEAKEISKQASKLRKEQNKQEKQEEVQKKEIKKNEKQEEKEIFAGKVSSIIDEVKKRNIKYYKIICLSDGFKYFSYAWVEDDTFHLLLDKKSYDAPDKYKFNEDGLISCKVKHVVLADEYSSYTTTTHTDAHVSVGGAIVGGMIGGTAGAILGGQKPASTKVSTESEEKNILYLNTTSIEIDMDSIPFIKDLIKGLKVTEKVNGVVKNDDNE